MESFLVSFLFFCFNSVSAIGRWASRGGGGRRRGLTHFRTHEVFGESLAGSHEISGKALARLHLSDAGAVARRQALDGRRTASASPACRHSKKKRKKKTSKNSVTAQVTKPVERLGPRKQTRCKASQTVSDTVKLGKNPVSLGKKSV